MRECERGDIVMISSAATISPRRRRRALQHGQGRHGGARLVTLAKEVKKFGIRVNVVAPGLVETEMGRRLMKATANVDDLRDLDAGSPFGRVCQPEDVANAVRFLVSERASYVTGEKLCVYGGPA